MMRYSPLQEAQLYISQIKPDINRMIDSINKTYLKDVRAASSGENSKEYWKGYKDILMKCLNNKVTYDDLTKLKNSSPHENTFAEGEKEGASYVIFLIDKKIV